MLVADAIGLNWFCFGLIFPIGCGRIIPLPIIAVISFVLLFLGTKKILQSKKHHIRLKILIAIFTLLISLSPYILKQIFRSIYIQRYYYETKKLNKKIKLVNYDQVPILTQNGIIQSINFQVTLEMKDIKPSEANILFNPQINFKNIYYGKATIHCLGESYTSKPNYASISHIQISNQKVISCKGDYGLRKHYDTQKMSPYQRFIFTPKLTFSQYISLLPFEKIINAIKWLNEDCKECLPGGVVIETEDLLGNQYNLTYNKSELYFYP